MAVELTAVVAEPERNLLGYAVFEVSVVVALD